MRELTMASIYITSSRPGAILSYHNIHTEHKKKTIAYAKGGTNMNEYKETVGTVSWADTGETMTFTDANEYLECIKENIEYMGIIGFKFRTLTRDPAVRKAVDDILYGEAGEENPHTIEYYEGGDNA